MINSTQGLGRNHLRMHGTSRNRIMGKLIGPACGMMGVVLSASSSRYFVSRYIVSALHLYRCMTIKAIP